MAGSSVRAGTKKSLEETLDAIRTLRNLEKTGREASSGDKAVMGRFCGFGALAKEAFPDPVTGEYKAGWEALGRQLRELLTDDEYSSAKASTFSAFYTSPTVMQAMHDAIAHMGVEVGSKGLEPGCGNGGFIAAAPPWFQFVGVEKDSLSARLAQAAFPEHEIRHEDFQDTPLPEGAVDFAIGNVPFADIRIPYGGQRHALHDFFFLKSLDAVRPGGVMAMVTSRFTLDKADPSVRKLLAEQADFVGAIRLPGEAFRDQGTEVVTDIIFLRKKPLERAEEPEWASKDWVDAGKVIFDGGEVSVNDYFVSHPEMVLGEMSVGHGMHNSQSLRVSTNGRDFSYALQDLIRRLPKDICTERDLPLTQIAALERDSTLPEGVQEGAFFVADDKTIMQVENGHAVPVKMREKVLRSDGTPGARKLSGLIELKERARAVLRTQQDGSSRMERDFARTRLRESYAKFVKSYGPINKTTLSTRQDGGITRRMPNILRFRSDPDAYLVMALENYDERTGEATPAAIMTQDVVTAAEPVTNVSNAKDGLLASLNQLGGVDIPFIAGLYGKSESSVIGELSDRIYFDPIEHRYVTSEAYLSGDIRAKLRFAEAWDDPRAEANAVALRAVQPEDLLPSEIDASLGTPWIPARDVQAFLVETLKGDKSDISVEYVQKEAAWRVKADSWLRSSVAATSEYGTGDINAYKLVEQALNMRTPSVKVRIPGGPGESDRFVVDQEATIAAQEKQMQLKARFSEWVWENTQRSERLARYYNDHYNNIRLREYDGEHLTFPGMSDAITLRPHQKAAVWRSIAGGNTLLAHTVGAGKTFEMVASAMEMRRTKLAKKPLIAMPNHMLEQFSREFLILYPDAKILVATKDDLKKDKRQLFKAKAATGDWDCVMMTHSSFEKIAMSPRYQAEFLEEQIREYEDMLVSVEDRTISSNITKRVEKLKERRKQRLKEAMNPDTRDGGLYFDEIGVDHIFVDEAHLFKNLETATKMTRVAGVQTTGSNRAFDLLMKIRYLQRKAPGRGVTFATGTPISNSLGEMYTMMRYLAPELLEERGIGHFDAWAAAFGEVVNALEISPDGKSLRVNARFAKFKNLPELLSMFRVFADVQTAEMLKLPVPKLMGGKPETVSASMSDMQSDMQDALVKRYERVRAGQIHPSDDNALAIVTDGRKLALDPRLLDPRALDAPDSKVNQMVDRIYEIWERTGDERLTQMVFSDLGVNPTEWGFSVYDDVVEKLVARGVPREEIATMGEANTDQKKESLFSNVRSGRVRVLLGSTGKMGTGTNVQHRLCALHHLDPPWRPADIEQRDGRILRQRPKDAPQIDEVEIYRYVTEGSFDAYMWQTLETKAKFIAQALRGDAGTRRADDIGGAELSYAEVKAIASGNPAMMTLAEIDMELRQLRLLRNAHIREQGKIASEVSALPDYISFHAERIAGLKLDVARVTDTKGDAFSMKVGDRTFEHMKGEEATARQRAQDALALAVAQAHNATNAPMPWLKKLGELGGFDVVLSAGIDDFTKGGRFTIELVGEQSHEVVRIQNPKNCSGEVAACERYLRGLKAQLATAEGSRDRAIAQLEEYKKRDGIPFASEDAFQTLLPLRNELRSLLRKDSGYTPEMGEVMDAFQAFKEKKSVASQAEVASPEPESQPAPSLDTAAESESGVSDAPVEESPEVVTAAAGAGLIDDAVGYAPETIAEEQAAKLTTVTAATHDAEESVAERPVETERRHDDATVDDQPAVTSPVVEKAPEGPPAAPAGAFRMQVGDHMFTGRTGAELALSDAVANALWEEHEDRWVHTLGELGGRAVRLMQDDSGRHILLDADRVMELPEYEDCGSLILEGLEGVQPERQSAERQKVAQRQAQQSPQIEERGDGGSVTLHRGQLTLFGTPPSRVASFGQRTPKPATASKPVQLGLFGEAAKPQTRVSAVTAARAVDRAAAMDVRQRPSARRRDNREFTERVARSDDRIAAIIDGSGGTSATVEAQR